MNILGFNVRGHDSAAALMADGKLLAACEQERYTRDKHSKKFPIDAINDCLNIAGMSHSDIDVVAFGGNPKIALLKQYLEPAYNDPQRIGMLIEEFEKFKRIYSVEDTLRELIGWTRPIHYFDHHMCHLASAFYASGFQESAVVSVDAIGDNKAMKIGIGSNNRIKIVNDSYEYPHSLGQIYAAITCYLGWKNVHHEGTIMALASYGDSTAMVAGQNRNYYSFFEEIIQYDGSYEILINQDWVDYYYMRDKWVSDRFIEVFGPRRDKNEELTLHHKHIAAGLQDRLVDVMLGILRKVRTDYDLDRLCLAGGVSLNCSMNGKIESAGIFDEMFVQPASGDSGLAIGACYLMHARENTRASLSHHNYYLGSRFDDDQIETALNQCAVSFSKVQSIYQHTADALAEGNIVGWFQGAAEFGPRALGNRSILARPYPVTMRDHLNSRVKHREAFRPFAPAILESRLYDYFEISQKSPHMLIGSSVKQDKIKEIPACVHVDGTARVQSVSEKDNTDFFNLIQEFDKITGCPVLLNTSFNVKGEPIVNSPADAIRCFLNSNVDLLVISNYVVTKTTIN